jgi:hypothetical protein
MGKKIKNNDKNISDHTDDDKIDNVIQKPRPRGRPRNNISHKQTKTKESNPKFTQEEVILHVPLIEEDSDNSDTNMFAVESDIDGKYIKNPFGMIESDSECTNKKYKLTLSEDNTVTSKSITQIKKLNEKIKEQELIIKNLKDKLTGSICVDSITSKQAYIDIKLIHRKSDEKICITKSKYACWWCAHEFNTYPCFLVETCMEDIYYVFGNFCTVGCGLKYNQKMINDFKSSQRASLTKILYTLILGTDCNFVPACEKEILEKFGGECSIADFRSKSYIVKNYITNMPPCVQLGIVQKLDE